MDLAKLGPRTLLSWFSMTLLVALVCALAVLQYRWIGEISQVERKKLQEQLQANLNKLSRDFNSELDNVRVLVPTDAEVTEAGREQAYANRYTSSKASTLHPELFTRIAIAWEANGQPVLRVLDPGSGTFVPADWPEDWSAMREWIAGGGRASGGGPRGGGAGRGAPADGTLIELPRFIDQGAGPGRGSERRGEQDWLLAEVDPVYAGTVILPELLARDLGPDFKTDYRVETVARNNPSKLIYSSDPQQDRRIFGDADASITLLDISAGTGRGPGPRSRGKQFGEAGDSGRGRWQLSVQHRSGSLEAVVALQRRRNLGVSAAILLLLLASAASLLRYSRQAQRLAEVEMEFVAGVSHELRTPLTVIRTAAYNLRGKIITNPTQVERYGALIQQESEKLTAIVEQVLWFASARAGQVIRERRPVVVESLVENSLQSSKGILDEAQYQVELQIEPGMPVVVGDSMALQHALQNLISNAVKYGSAGGRWIGISARATAGRDGSGIEIRVSDRGPGIPPDEQRHLFDAFFRGNKAVRDQIHGTGLGLNLVKRIVEAHGGTVTLESEPGAGTSFIVRLPTSSAKGQDELAHSTS